MKSVLELLSNYDIIYYCKLLKINLIDVLQKDKFININNIKEGCYVINLQDSTKGGGTHWTCLILKNNYSIYYDSYGLSIPTPIIQFIKKFNKNIKLYYSIDQIQTLDSIFCGWYCIYFLYFMTVQYKTNENYKYLINKHNQIFNLENKYLNDKILRVLIKNIFKL